MAAVKSCLKKPKSCLEDCSLIQGEQSIQSGRIFMSQLHGAATPSISKERRPSVRLTKAKFSMTLSGACGMHGTS